jgi:hypothetical protein
VNAPLKWLPPNSEFQKLAQTRPQHATAH